MFHRCAFQVEIFRINRLLVQDLVQLCTEILHPVVPLGAGAMVAQGLNVDDSRDVARATAVFELANLLPFVIENVRAAAERVNGRGFFREEVIGADVGGEGKPASPVPAVFHAAARQI